MSVAWLCPTLCNPTDYSLPGSSVQGILQARILEWVAIPFSGGSFQPRVQTQVSKIYSEYKKQVASHFLKKRNKVGGFNTGY